MPWQVKWSLNAINIQVQSIKLWWFIGYIEGLQNIWAEACYGLVMIHEGVSLSDQIHFNAYESIELDICAYVACYEMTSRINFEIWFWGPRIIMLVVVRNKSRLIAQGYTHDG
jgi:hypothetical protein